MLKSPEDILIYQQLLEVVKPKTIIEFGTYCGGTALWFADMSALIVGQCEVYSVDNDPSLIDESVMNLKPSNLSFIKGDSYKVEKIFDSKTLSQMAHPLLITEDSHHNTGGLLRYFHPYLKVGDYFVVEDTNPLPSIAGLHHSDQTAQKANTEGNGKLKIVEEFLLEYKDQYAVDSFFADFYGYNYTFNVNSWIARIK